VVAVSDRSTLTAGDVVRVLVVGDSPRAEDASAALRATLPGASVRSARSDDDALEVISEGSVDCVLPDVPAGDRTLVLEAIRARGPVPIVALVEEGSATDALEAGATDVVYPGESPEAVATRVTNAIERSRPGEGRYRSILETQRLPVLVLGEEDALEYATPAVETVTGYTPDEIARKGVFGVLHPEDREDAREAIADVRGHSPGTTRRERYRFRHADDTWRVLEATMESRLADPAIGGVVLTLQRPTGGDERVERTLEALDGVFLALGTEWEIEYASGTTSVLFDRPAEDLEGTVLWELLPEAVRGRFYERVHEARARGSVVVFEVELDGWLEVHVHPGEAGAGVYAREVAPPGAERDRVDSLETVLDALEVAVLGLEDGRVTVANTAAFDFLTVETPVGYTLAELFDPDLAGAIEQRVTSPVRRVDPIETTLEVDGGPRPVAVSVTPLPGDGRGVCVIRDVADRRSRDAALSTLSTAARELGRAETLPEVRQAVADAVAEALRVDVVATYVLEDGRRARPAAVAAAGEDPDLPTVDVDATPLGNAEGARARTHDPAAFEGLLTRGGVRADRVLTAPVGGEHALLATTTGPAGFDDHALEVVDAVAAIGERALEGTERESELRDREDAIERKAATVERTVATVEVTRALTRELLRADSREEIEATACRHLAELEWLEFAWIGEADLTTETVTPRARAGADEGYLEDVTVTLDPDAAEPAGRAVATGEPAAVENVLEEPDSAWRRATLECDVASVLAVPIAYDEYVYGVLAVSSGRPAAFRGGEETFAWLGETIAYAINAVETRRALLAEGVTELEVAVEGEDPLLALAARVDARLEVATVVPRSAGESTVFLTVTDGAVETVRETVSDLEGLESARETGDREAGSVVELRVSDSTLAATVADHGGLLVALSGGGERPHALVELPRGSDVRSFLRMLEGKFPGTELLARRERDRAVRTLGAFRTELTDRQLRTLEAAYYSGFFEWPRESTGEEVAASLGVSQPTFNRHYRAAERTLFSLLFEENGG